MRLQKATMKHAKLAIGWSVGCILLIYVSGAILTKIALSVDMNEPKVPTVTSMEGKKYDVLYLGNSVALEAVNPAVIDAFCNTKSYNCALGGASITEMEYILRAYLAQNEKPALIVLGVTPNLGDCGNGIRPTVYLAMKKEHRDAYLQKYGKHRSVANEVLIRIPAYRHRSSIEPFLKYLVRGRNRLPKYVQGHLAVPDVKPVPEHFPPRQADINIGALTSLRTLCEAEGLPLLIVELPNSPSFNESVVGKRAVCEQMRECYSGRPLVRFASFNDESAPSFEKDEWLGYNHFNARGAIRFSEILAPLIAETLNEFEAPPTRASPRVHPAGLPPGPLECSPVMIPSMRSR